MHEMVASIAHHEAGHAVRAWWLHVELIRVCIDREKSGSGFCERQNGTRRMLAAGAPVSSISVEDEASICLAGTVAEARYQRFRLRGTLSPEGSQDGANAWEVLTRWQQARYGQADGIDLWLWLIQQRVQRFLRSPKAWRAVEALATALLAHGHLVGEDAKRIITGAYGRRGVPSHWRQPFEWSDPSIGPLLDTVMNQHQSPLA
jgi:hypothetical protein